MLLFFFPLLFGSILQQLYNMADAAVVGRYLGKVALATVGGTTSTLIFLCTGFFIGLSSGATVIISQHFGAGRYREVEQSVHTIVAFAIVGGLALSALGIWLAPAALRAMGTLDEILPSAIDYLRIYFVGFMPSLVYKIISGILRAVGDSKRPLYILAFCCVCNVALDLLFVAVFHWGVAGAAWATVLSQLASAALVCHILLRSDQCYRLQLKKLRIHGQKLLDIIRIGLPAAFQSLTYSSSNVFVQAAVNRFDTNTIAGWSAYGKVDGIFWMLVGSMGTTVMIFVGQNYGAHNEKRLNKSILSGFLLCMGMTAALSALLCAFGSTIIGVFTKDADVLRQGVEILEYLAPLYCLYVTVEILSGALRGLGNSLAPMVMAGFGISLLRIAWLLAVVPQWPTLRGVLTSYPLSWIVTSAAFAIYFWIFTSRRRKQRQLGENIYG